MMRYLTGLIACAERQAFCSVSELTALAASNVEPNPWAIHLGYRKWATATDTIFMAWHFDHEAHSESYDSFVPLALVSLMYVTGL